MLFHCLVVSGLLMKIRASLILIPWWITWVVFLSENKQDFLSLYFTVMCWPLGRHIQSEVHIPHPVSVENS